MSPWMRYFIDLSYCEDFWKKSDEEEIDRYSASPFVSRQIDWMKWLNDVRETAEE